VLRKSRITPSRLLRKKLQSGIYRVAIKEQPREIIIHACPLLRVTILSETNLTYELTGGFFPCLTKMSRVHWDRQGKKSMMRLDSIKSIQLYGLDMPISRLNSSDLQGIS
jgi:Leu/Phe-tRNA-protein transferase